MVDILTSIHGKKLGLDSSGNLVVGGGLVINNDTTPVQSNPTVATATTAANLTPYGVTTLSTALVTYTLSNPVPGQRVTITSLLGATAQSRIVQTTTGVATFDGTNNKWVSTGVQTLELVGVTTARYAVISNIVGGATTSIGTFSTI